jgi:hypothetical protein
MKTPIKTVLVLLLSVITFFSCSKDDDDNNNNNTGSIRTELVGTWESPTIGERITFKSDGTGFLTAEGTVEEFNWGATSNIITLQDDEGDIEKYPYKLLDDDTISITLTDEDDLDVDVIFYRE